MDQIDLGWLVGVLDSEGAIGIRSCSGGASLEPIVQMETTCERTAERVVALCDSLGISARSYRVRQRKPQHRQSFALRVTRLADVQRLARKLAPHAVTKQAQWQIADEFTTLRLAGRHLDASGRVQRGGNRATRPYSEQEIELWQRMKELNQRGPRPSV